MTDTIFHRFVMSILFVAVMMAVSLPASTHAGQMSTDSRLLSIYEQVDDRNRVHAIEAGKAFKGLEAMELQAKAFEDEIENIPSNLSATEYARREHILTAKLINVNAQIHNKFGKFLDARITVIAANLTDLAGVVKEMQKSGGSTGKTQEIQQRIATNIATGQAMRLAANELRNWAAQDPSMRNRFKSLSRLMKTLDSKISLDKINLAGRQNDILGGRGDRTIATLDAAIDRLADEHVQIMAEKQALSDAREQLDISIRLGRLRVTEAIARRTFPSSGPEGASFSTLTSIGMFSDRIAKINERIILEMNETPLGDDTLTPVSGGFGDYEFTNF